jgi:hypothetical protein
MISPRRISTLALLCLLYLARPELTAQDTPLQLKVDVPLVSLDVSVLDASGRPLTNLTQEDFLVFTAENARSKTSHRLKRRITCSLYSTVRAARAKRGHFS